MACTIIVTAPLTSGEVVIPLTAVWSSDKDSSPCVWLIDGGRVRAVRIKLGPLYGSDMVVVTKGLSAGMEIVSAGVYKLSDGQRVAIIN
jgi:multidrug efflux pump subunit AcrA (membrane-fusion protein)